MNVQEFKDGVLVYSRTYDTTAGTVTVFKDGVSTAYTADPEDLAAIAEAKAIQDRTDRLNNAVTTLRLWASEAKTVDVAPMTVTQHKAVTQTVVTRLGIFFDRFADLLDER